MITPAWQLEGHQARLETPSLGATLDATHPEVGLTHICAAGLRLDALRLLRLEPPPTAAPGPGVSLAECHVRGSDLTASYRESPAWPVQIDKTWRAVRQAQQDRVVAAIELVISVRTSLLETRSDLTICTAASGTEAYRLIDAAAARFQPLGLSAGHVATIEPQAGPGCLVLRLPDTPLSYTEMTHPADFHCDRLISCEGARVELRHQLFPGMLEKGVILRARVRAAIVVSDGDLKSAAACYAAFAAAEPPLGT